MRTWFDVAWQLTTAKSGMSGLMVAETVGVSYQVAWPMLHRYRVAMVRADRDPLHGDVEVDEPWWAVSITEASAVGAPRSASS